MAEILMSLRDIILSIPPSCGTFFFSFLVPLIPPVHALRSPASPPPPHFPETRPRVARPEIHSSTPLRPSATSEPSKGLLITSSHEASCSQRPSTRIPLLP